MTGAGVARGAAICGGVGRTVVAAGAGGLIGLIPGAVGRVDTGICEGIDMLLVGDGGWMTGLVAAPGG